VRIMKAWWLWILAALLMWGCLGCGLFTPQTVISPAENKDEKRHVVRMTIKPAKVEEVQPCGKK